MILDLIWISMLVNIFLWTIFLLYILERYSPFSYRNNRAKYRNDQFSSLKDFIWFTFTSTFQGGYIPKHLSSKLVMASCSIFVIVAAYTANLAADRTLKVGLKRNIESKKASRDSVFHLIPRTRSNTFHVWKKSKDFLKNLSVIWKKKLELVEERFFEYYLFINKLPNISTFLSYDFKIFVSSMNVKWNMIILRI